jgi:REP element-mobilizing transposase RayT
MPNPRRIHVPGGTYYLFRKTDSRYPIFSEPKDYRRFEDLLTIALESSRAKLFGYCWMPDAIHLAVEISDRPVARIMRDLMWRYSHRHWQRADNSRPWFRERYRATLVQAEVYLEALICHLHYLPVRATLAECPNSYPYTSHHAYLRHPFDRRVYTRRLLQSLGCRGDDRSAYHEAMAQVPPDSLARIFERGLLDTPGIVGDQTFVAERCNTQHCIRVSTSLRRLDRLIAQIAGYHSVSLDELCSKSRLRVLVLARAQIAWFAILWDLASMTDIARRLHHSPSALSRAVVEHRRRRPELFKPEAIAPTSLAPSTPTQIASG